MTTRKEHFEIRSSGGTILNFAEAIEQQIYLPDALVIRFKSARLDNVAAFDSGGNQLWKATPLMTREGPLPFDGMERFGTNIRLSALDAYRLVDGLSGATLKEYWEK